MEIFKQKKFIYNLPVALILLFIIFSPKLHAQYTLCNKTSYSLNTAIAYGKTNNDDIETYGWWRLRPGDCKVVITDKLDRLTYFAYAESLDTHQGSTKIWSGDQPFCISEGRFFTQDDQTTCRTNNRLQRDFFKVALTDNDGGRWRTEFKETNDFSIQQSQIAGVQRMLKELNYNISVDGDFGAQTRRTIVTYKKSQNLTSNDTIDASLIDRLIEQTEKKITNIGLYVCNKSNFPIWVARYHIGKSNKNASGWWFFPPSVCQKLINSRIPSGDHYFYAIQERDNKEYETKNGTETACVNPILFSIENVTNCADQGFESASFVKLPISNQEHTSFDIIQEMFSTKAMEKQSFSAIE